MKETYKRHTRDLYALERDIQESKRKLAHLHMGHRYLQRDLHMNKRDLYSKRPIFRRKRHTRHTRDIQETYKRHKRDRYSFERDIQETYKRPIFTRERHTTT